MQQGEKVRATWSDGLTLVGYYVGTERGYVILHDEDGKRIVCSQAAVKFEVIDENR